MFEVPVAILEELKNKNVLHFIPHLGIGLGIVGVCLSAGFLFKPPSKVAAVPPEAADICVNQVYKGEVTVYVSGAVKYPGIYALETGNRIAHALTAAGGTTEDADSAYLNSELNLAEPLIDGKKIYIPTQQSSTNETVSKSVTTTVDDSKVSINSASVSELESLPKVGVKTAEKIISNRPYASFDELVEKGSVSATVFAEINELISL